MIEGNEGFSLYVSAYGRVERLVLNELTLPALRDCIAKHFELTGDTRIFVQEDGQELCTDAQVADAVKRSRSLRAMPGDRALADLEQKMTQLRQMQLGFFQDELLQLRHDQTSTKDESQRLRNALEMQSQMLGEMAKELRAEQRAREESEQRLMKQHDELRELLRGDQRGQETGEATLRQELQEVRQEVLRLSAASERDVSELQKAVGKEAKTRGKTIEALLSEWASWASSQQELRAELLEVKALAEQHVADLKPEPVNKPSMGMDDKPLEWGRCQVMIEKTVSEHVRIQLEVGAKAVSERLNEKLQAAIEEMSEEVRMVATDAAEAVCRAEEAAIDAAAARRTMDCFASDSPTDGWRGRQCTPPQAPAFPTSSQAGTFVDPYKPIQSFAPPIVMSSGSAAPLNHGRVSPPRGTRSPSSPPQASPALHSSKPSSDSTVSVAVPVLPLGAGNPGDASSQQKMGATQGVSLLATSHFAHLPQRKSLGDPRNFAHGISIAGNGGA
eukprot:gnl/MRDRNA2_/MRDRNA2_34410_c0_seq1.p1 gnl/MRDRNA2_/MRDRNA2_34410_c0~~gnl/MRDRNA2_/MRDRNA2_34410_c0_seq1.p1  ORF type:complete len:502 (+),score=121.74 gnl/MRDRNA2_/MRDRNA2_34410_c0_seq1:108-1613(+)